MTRPGLSTDQSAAAYRAELRAVGRRERLAGFVLILCGAVAVWAGGGSQAMLWLGYAALGAGWALMLAAIFLRTRYHRRRIREVS